MVTVPRMANWDTAYGYELYLQGKSDGEIADECKVKISTITSYRLKNWRKKPDGNPRKSAPPDAGMPPAAVTRISHTTAEGGGVSAFSSREKSLETEGKEVAGVDEQKERKSDIARMMEVIAKMTSGMGGIKAVCIGNVIQALWNCSCVDDIREAMSILGWMEENYDFG